MKPGDKVVYTGGLRAPLLIEGVEYTVWCTYVGEEISLVEWPGFVFPTHLFNSYSAQASYLELFV